MSSSATAGVATAAGRLIPAFHEPIHILGSGSIGLLWAASIRSKFPTYPVTLLVRDRHRPQFEREQRQHQQQLLPSSSHLSPSISTSAEIFSSSTPNVHLFKERCNHDDDGLEPHFVHQQQLNHTLQQQQQQHICDVDNTSRPEMRISWERYRGPAATTHLFSNHKTADGRHHHSNYRRGEDFNVDVDDHYDHLLPPALASRQKHNSHYDGILSVPVEFVTKAIDGNSAISDLLNSSNNSNNNSTVDNDGISSSLFPIYNLIVTTKSYQAKDAVKSILPRLLLSPPNTSQQPQQQRRRRRIVVLCNGALAVKEQLETLIQDTKQELLDAAKTTPTMISTTPSASFLVDGIDNIDIVLATTTHGVYRRSTSSVTSSSAPSDDENDRTINTGTDATHRHLVHAGIGKTFIEDHSSSKCLGDLFCQVGLNCTTLSRYDMDVSLWKKLAANCVINPLTALYQCTNGELLLEPTFPMIQKQVLTEIANVMNAIKHKPSASLSHDSATTLVDGVSDTFESLQLFVSQVIEDTKHNKSSMYQDILNNRQTEISQLNGFVVQKGKDVGVNCGANEDLMIRIKELEQRQKEQHQSL